MGEEDVQMVGCLFVIVINFGDIFFLCQYNCLVMYCVCFVVNVVVNVSDMWIVEGGDVLLQLFSGGGVIIYDDYFLVVVVLV